MVVKLVLKFWFSKLKIKRQNETGKQLNKIHGFQTIWFKSGQNQLNSQFFKLEPTGGCGNQLFGSIS